MVGQAAFLWMLRKYRTKLWKKMKTRPPVPSVTFMKFPMKLETNLRIGIKAAFKAQTRLFYAWFDSHKESWRREWVALHPRNDSLESDIEAFITSFESEFEVISKNTTLSLSAEEYVNRVSEALLTFSSGQLAKQLAKFLGESFYGGTEWWDVVKKSWIKEVNNRIVASQTEFFEAVRKTVYSGVRNNTPFDTIVSKIQKLEPKLLKSRASFLARDLIGTLHSKITQHMHLTLGIEFYMWQTQADERVRGRPGGKYPNALPSHWDMEGLVCSWNDPTTYSSDGGKTWQPRKGPGMTMNHPGVDWACRCVGRPILVDIVDEVDESVRGAAQ